MSTNFRGVDYFGIDVLLSEEEKMVRDTARDFVSKEVIPIIEKHNQEMTFPGHLIPLMAGRGMFGPTLPEKYGGLAMNNVAYGLMMTELERGDSGVRSFASVQSSLVMYPIFAFGSEEQRMKWLPALARAEKIGCFGLTEPDHGSNPAGMLTNAKKVSRNCSSASGPPVGAPRPTVRRDSADSDWLAGRWDRWPGAAPAATDGSPLVP